MGNSFNISVKPEIAAAVVKIDAIDAIVDLIRSTDVPNIQTNINVNETTILANQDILDLIRGTDVGDIQTNINANETAILANKDILDVIQAKTDLIPQNVRGTFSMAQLSLTNNTSLQDVLNITGQGKLCLLQAMGPYGSNPIIQLTIDGDAFTLYNVQADCTNIYLYPSLDPENNTLTLAEQAAIFRWDASFDTSLLIQMKTSSGADKHGYCKVYYILDDF